MRIFQVWISKLGLWFSIASIISLGFLGFLIVFVLLSERAFQESTDKLFEERLAITQLVADQFDTLLRQAIVELQQANRVIDFDTSEAGLLQDAEVWLKSYGQVGHFSPGIVLLDYQGRVITSDPSNLYEVDADLSGFSYIDDVIKSGELSIADPFLHPLDEYPVTAVTIPLFQDGQVIGFLSGLIDLTSAETTLPLKRAIAIGQTEHADLVDANGRTLISTTGLPFLSPGEHSVFFISAMSSKIPQIATVPFEFDLPGEPLGHLHVMGFVPLQTVDWGVSVGGDADEEFLAGAVRLRNSLLLLAVLSIGSILIITLIATRRLVQPIKGLTEAAHQIADGNLTVPFALPKGGGEISVMSSALDRMRNQMMQNITELSEMNKKLERRVAEQTNDLRHQQQLTQHLLQQVITAQESERGRVAYELHDEIGQMLAAVEMSISHLSDAVPSDNEILNTRLTRTHQLIEKTVIDLRHIISALRPTVLDQLGLIPALDWICDQMLVPLKIDVTLQTPQLEAQLAKEVETILFRIAQEAINNIVRHSQATRVIIKLEESKTDVILRVEDNGKGFDLKMIDSMPIVGRKLGLDGIRERATLINGEVIISSKVGEGTAVTVSIPQPKQSVEGETNVISTN